MCHVRKSDIHTFCSAGDFDFGPNFLNSQREALEDLDWKCACTGHKKSQIGIQPGRLQFRRKSLPIYVEKILLAFVA